MRIKRYAALFLAAALALSLAGCGMNEDKNKAKDGGMPIAPAPLTVEMAAEAAGCPRRAAASP